jgi:hypothetical protein
MQWEKSGLSKHLGRMVGRGLLARERCATDQRGAVIVLTETGLRAFVSAQRIHLAHVRELFDVLSTEQLNALGELAEIILAHIDAIDRDHDGAQAQSGGADTSGLTPLRPPGQLAKVSSSPGAPTHVSRGPSYAACDHRFGRVPLVMARPVSTPRSLSQCARSDRLEAT